MGRRDADHGYYAAMNCFGKFDEIWRKYNYDETVSAILKDADALDRCRFHVNGRLDRSYLINKDVSVSLIPLTEAICTHTSNYLDKEIAFSDFIDFIV